MRTGKAGACFLGKHRPSPRQCTALLAAALLAGACSRDSGIASPPSAGQIDYLRGFIGGVAADEPRAALVARDILSAGGSAADAVAAAAFAYSVTYPAAGGLGAGGVCVVSNPTAKRIETIEFPTAAAAAGGAHAVPGLPRGMGLLHSRHGKLRWESLLTPAEQLARFGEPASRAFVQSAVEAQPPVTGSPGLTPVFGTRTGLVPQEGERRSQPALAATLARLRSVGPHDFYQGMMAQMLVADSAAGGGRLGLDDLRGYAAAVGKPIEVPFDNNVIVYTTANPGGGAIAAWLIEQGFEVGTLGNMFGIGTLRTDRFAAALGQAYGGNFAGAPMYGFGSSSIAVMDRTGMAVACAFSMGTAFGSRVAGRESGVLFARPPGSPGDEAPYLAAAIGYNPRVTQSFFAAGSSGGVTSAAAMSYSILQAALGKNRKDPAVPALDQPRLFQAGPQSPLLHEPGVDATALSGARTRGVTTAETGRLGRVNLAYCENGLPRSPDTCSFAADRRGYGLAIGRQF